MNITTYKHTYATSIIVRYATYILYMHCFYAYIYMCVYIHIKYSFHYVLEGSSVI